MSSARLSCSVQAVVVNYNGAATIERCLSSLTQAATNFQFDVLVVDNGSIDDSLEAAKLYDSIEIIEAPVNLGFGAANNLAFRKFNRKYFYLHNVDAYLPPETLQLAIECMERDTTIGILGLPLSYPDGSPQPYAFSKMSAAKKFIQILGLRNVLYRLISHERVRSILLRSKIGQSARSILIGQDFRTLESVKDIEEINVHDVDWVCGAAMIIRKSTIDSIGMFDENFFMYYEDEDICRRAAVVGIRVCTIATPAVIHDCGWTNKSRQSNISKARINSAKIFLKKHYGFGVEYLLLRLMLIAFPNRW